MCDCKAVREQIPGRAVFRTVIRYCATHEAAPKMLAALRAMLDTMVGSGYSDSVASAESKQAVILARAAIDKALQGGTA